MSLCLRRAGMVIGIPEAAWRTIPDLCNTQIPTELVHLDKILINLDDGRFRREDVR